LNAMLTTTAGEEGGEIGNTNFPAGCTSAAGYSTATGLPCNTVSGLPAGCASTTGYSSTTGQSCSGGNTPGVTMTGAEGTITASVNPAPANNTIVYEGNSKIAVYGLKVQATGSDMDVQRVTLRFGKQPYSYFSNIYLYDGSNEIATAALNSSTVQKVSSTDYEITLGNFAQKFIVTNGATKVLTAKIDVMPGISSGLLPTAGTTITLGTATTTSVRAVDQAGLNQYSGVAWASARTVTIKPSQSSDATLTISRNLNSPLARNIVADNTGDITGETLLTFNIKATKDTILVDQINNVAFTTGGAYVDPTTVYLVDDAGTTIGTGTPSSNEVDFQDLNYTINKDTTKTFSIKIDKASVVTAKTMAVTITGNATNIVATKSNGATVDTGYVTGSAASYVAYIYTIGPVMTLLTAPTTQENDKTSDQSGTSTVTTTFNVQVTAKGGAVYLPTTGAFDVYYNNATAVAGANVVYTKPTGADAVTVSAVDYYKIAEDETVTFAVNATYATTTAGYYYLNVYNVDWATGTDSSVTASTSTFMASGADWKGTQVYLP